MSEVPVAATVRHVWPVTPHLVGVVLEVAAEVAARYERPGQVIALGGESPTYLAIASQPGEAQALELLVAEKVATEFGLVRGAKLSIKPPHGPGFPVEAARGRDVLVFGVGSALSAVRPLVEVLRRNRSDYGKISVYVGAHTEADLAYREFFDDWRRDRIDVSTSVSRPWVQEVFLADPPPLDDCFAFVVGLEAMVRDVTQMLRESGLPGDCVGKNW